MTSIYALRLRKIREKLGGKQATWSIGLGLPSNTISKIENNQKELKVDLLIAIFENYIPNQDDRDYILYGKKVEHKPELSEKTAKGILNSLGALETDLKNLQYYMEEVFANAPPKKTVEYIRSFELPETLPLIKERPKHCSFISRISQKEAQCTKAVKPLLGK